MKVLGIETSCDETAVCLIEAKGDFGESFNFKTLGNTLISQAALHSEYGGVFPNLAKREHAKNLVPILAQTLESAGMLKQTSTPAPGAAFIPLKETLSREPELFTALAAFLLRYEKPDIDCIGVTHGPGLEPALWVGINFARSLSAVWNIPIVPVNHMEGHLVMPMMEIKNDAGKLRDFEFPVLALLISGGHTELVLSKSFGEYEIVGATRDDAAGEAFDKVARLLGLPYPGGPEIGRLAHEARSKKLEAAVKLPRPMINDDTFDFSFSGLKTAVRRLVDGKTLSENEKKHIARETEDAIADVLVSKTIRAAEEHGAETILIGGGVSANTHIRKKFTFWGREANRLLLLPIPELSTDNALMIALAGYFHALNRDFVNLDMLKANGNLQIGQET